MAKLGLPIADESLDIYPKLPPNIPLTNEVQQTLSLILGYSNSDRVPLRASPSGILYTCTPRISDIIQWLAVANDELHQGPELPCSIVLLRCALANTGNVYVSVRKTATITNSLPLQKGEWVIFSIENLSELHCLIATAGDVFIVMHSL